MRDRDFLELFGARLVSSFGSAMAPIAMAFGVLELTGSASDVGIVIAAQSGAQVAVQLLGGALADRTSRKRLMVWADLLALVSQGTVALLLLTGNADVPLLFGLMLVTGVAFALHWPAAIGLVPLVVDRSELQEANGLLQLARSGAIGLGASAGGVLVATVGSGWALAIDAATFGLSAALVAHLRVGPQIRTASVTLLHDLRDGWYEFTAHRWLWTIVLQFTFMVAAWEGTYAVLGPTVADRWLGGPTDWGWIAGASGAGLVVGGLIALRLQVARPMLVATCMIFPSILPPLLLSVPAPVGVIAAGAFVSSIGGQIFAVLWYTALHKHVAPEAISRVSAYDSVGSIALAPLGIVSAGFLLESIGATPTLWIAVAMILVPTVAVLAVPEVRNLR